MVSCLVQLEQRKTGIPGLLRTPMKPVPGNENISPSRMRSDYGFMDWKPELGTRVHVVALDGSGVRSYDAPPFFTFHYANCYEERLQGERTAGGDGG